MIVLDEQLIGYDFPSIIGRWYPGAVVNIIQLRPRTLIPDEDIPTLLRSIRQPTFVTINVADFWRRMAPDRHFCIVCFSLLDRELEAMPLLLRRLFKIEPFRSRRSRLGKIARISQQQAQYYTADSWAVQTLRWSMR